MSTTRRQHTAQRALDAPGSRARPAAGAVPASSTLPPAPTNGRAPIASSTATPGAEHANTGFRPKGALPDSQRTHNADVVVMSAPLAEAAWRLRIAAHHAALVAHLPPDALVGRSLVLLDKVPSDDFDASGVSTASAEVLGPWTAVMV